MIKSYCRFFTSFTWGLLHYLISLYQYNSFGSWLLVGLYAAFAHESVFLSLGSVYLRFLCKNFRYGGIIRSKAL